MEETHRKTFVLNDSGTAHHRIIILNRNTDEFALLSCNPSTGNLLLLSPFPHSYPLFKAFSFSNNGNKPLKANAVRPVKAVPSFSSASPPSCTGSAHQPLKPNKGNPLTTVIACTANRCHHDGGVQILMWSSSWRRSIRV